MGKRKVQKTEQLNNNNNNNNNFTISDENNSNNNNTLGYLKQKPNGDCLITVSVKPNAKATKILQISNDEVQVSISEPPQDGKANEEVIEFFAAVLGKKRSQVSIERGQKARDKVLLVSSMSLNDVHNRLSANLQ